MGLLEGGETAANRGSGDNPATALLAVLGNPLKRGHQRDDDGGLRGTHAQFLDGHAIKGNALGLRIAASNMHNLVDLATGGFGAAIQDAINSTQTTTMANFATLSSLMAGCTTRVRSDACNRLFAATTPPGGKTPADTLIAAQSIAHNATHEPTKVFDLLDAFYPVPKGKTLRPTPYMSYLSYAPSAWVLPIKFTGGGLSAAGKSCSITRAMPRQG